MGTCTIIIKYAIAFATGVLLTKGIATMDTITIVSGIVTAILTSIVALKDVLLSIAETSFDVASDDSSIDDYEVDTTEHYSTLTIRLNCLLKNKRYKMMISLKM